MTPGIAYQIQGSPTLAALQKEADRLQLLLNVTHILPWEASRSISTFTYVGEKADEMFGYPAKDWYQPDFWPAHLHPDDRGRAIAKCHGSANPLDHYEFECRMIAKDGRVVWLHNLITVTRENGSPDAIRGFSIDITTSKENETALRNLTGRLINAQEEERRRVARELHDDLNQRMALLSIALGQLTKIKEPADMGRRLKSVQNQAREISADIHRLSYKLHPAKLDYLGLAPAVKSLCQEISALGDLEVEFQQGDLPEDLDRDVTLCVFRIAQEALRNCAKHSGADSAMVTLESSEEGIRLRVSDAGSGFDTESEAMKKGLGFTSMRERLRIVGGKMDVRSQPMHGTVIEVSVPVGQE